MVACDVPNVCWGRADFGDVHIYVGPWVKHVNSVMTKIEARRIDVIASLVDASRFQNDVFQLIRQSLPQPIAESVLADFAGWPHYDIVSAL
jgi:transcription antitermination factor NusA-like protein